MGILNFMFGKAAQPVVNEPVWSDDVMIEDEPFESIKVYDPKGKALVLKESICEGGEGKIYVIPKSDFLIKIYHDRFIEDPVKIKKILPRIADMVNMTDIMNDLDDNIAWPRLGVYNSNRSDRKLIGFAMKKMEGRQFRSLHYVNKIEKNYPNWDRRALAVIANNFVRAVDKLHRRNILINDFNPSNFFVDINGRVRFIDCDSYQVTGKSKTHHNSAHFPTHCAPELLSNPALLKSPRMEEHDLFGVAITVYQILMMGLHPYSRIGCEDPEQNLRSGVCALGTGASCQMPEGNWYNLWSHLPYRLKSLFVSTFREGHQTPAMRATLEQWNNELEAYIRMIDKGYMDTSLRPDYAKTSEYKGSEENIVNFSNNFGNATT